MVPVDHRQADIPSADGEMYNELEYGMLLGKCIINWRRSNW